ncbi:hypothetical protein MLD38_025614 [Melastoma candidum]|uniref:Uncharacterized protein n=1 Tax=Melastoma candidum TaxID=119954 RepID=A0ACB9NVZ3_9MYRT|nr:hypothetical protein MLD38_025614 [Melastoma candidum]
MENGELVCPSESVNGTTDLWSCNPSSSPDHLLVMVNGILGSDADWKFAAEMFVRMLPHKIFVHCSERNIAGLTLDGVDVMGDRLAEEVLEVINRKPKLRKISFVAHSVGGLVARYAIGRLYRPPAEEACVEESSVDKRQNDSRGTIGELEAMNFIMVATPHLGSRGNWQVPFLFGMTALEKLACSVIHLIFRRTGQHLFLNDCDEGKAPLLQRMAYDHDYPFMSALRIFKRRVAYSNAHLDHIVGWRTSSIRRHGDLPKWQGPVNEKYPHVVYEEHCKACGIWEMEPLTGDLTGGDKLEEELVTRLSCLSWEKIDVSFNGSWKKFAAHSIIQVKDQRLHREGEDVLQHMIDHFLI